MLTMKSACAQTKGHMEQSRCYLEGEKWVKMLAEKTISQEDIVQCKFLLALS
ncbi:hypothetical protein DY000_02005555 [Brassica cretica]|uniref:Uncharacterized protein n=1 Tax=Brassica cretica TaxID=69181 RepID=A0ABQ7C852_BRACR|nr:hypothetical protein DY000_02005555 [Brassica cretica]